MGKDETLMKFYFIRPDRSDRPQFIFTGSDPHFDPDPDRLARRIEIRSLEPVFFSRPEAEPVDPDPGKSQIGQIPDPVLFFLHGKDRANKNISSGMSGVITKDPKKRVSIIAKGAFGEFQRILLLEFVESESKRFICFCFLAKNQ